MHELIIMNNTNYDQYNEVATLLYDLIPEFVINDHFFGKTGMAYFLIDGTTLYEEPGRGLTIKSPSIMYIGSDPIETFTMKLIKAYLKRMSTGPDKPNIDMETVITRNGQPWDLMGSHGEKERDILLEKYNFSKEDLDL